jgi:hypothetical protein
MKYLKTLTEKWCGDHKQDSEGRIDDTGAQLESQYQKLQEIFVDIPSKAFPSGTKKHKDWKSHGTPMVQHWVRGFPVSHFGITYDRPNFKRFPSVDRTVSPGFLEVVNRYNRGPSPGVPR